MWRKYREVSTARYQKMNKYLMLSTPQTQYNNSWTESSEVTWLLHLFVDTPEGTMGVFTAHFLVFGLFFLYQSSAAPPVEVTVLNTTEYREAKGIFFTKILYCDLNKTLWVI